jgi:hypothetical protein
METEMMEESIEALERESGYNIIEERELNTIKQECEEEPDAPMREFEEIEIFFKRSKHKETVSINERMLLYPHPGQQRTRESSLSKILLEGRQKPNNVPEDRSFEEE